MADEMENPLAGLRARDSNGLTWKQRRWLVELEKTGNWRTACKTVGVSQRSVRRWLQSEPGFLQSYNDQFQQTNEELMSRLDVASARAVDMLVDALDTVEKGFEVMVDCPHACGEQHKTTVLIPDWKQQRDVIDRILKVKGLFVDKHQVQVTGQVTHLHELSAGEQIIYARWRHGYEVPAHNAEKFRSLQAQGLLAGPIQSDGSDVIEGEATEVSDESSS